MSAGSPAVSVVMSVYNGAAFLEQAVQSVLRQDFRDLELIVIDDGSVDRTAALIAGIGDPRFRTIRNERNLGLARSLNAGIAAARAPYIARQDADDVSLPARLRRQVEFLEEHPEVGLLGTGVAVVDERGRPLATLATGGSDTELRERLRRGNCFVHGSVMLRRAVVTEVGGYRELETCQDYDLWFRMADRCRIAALPQVLYRWRLNTSSLSVRKTSLQLAYIALVRQLAEERRRTGADSFRPDLRPVVPPSPWGFAVDERALPYLVLAGRFAAYGKRCRAVAFGLRGLARDPWNARVWQLVFGAPFGRRGAARPAAGAPAP